MPEMSFNRAELEEIDQLVNRYSPANTRDLGPFLDAIDGTRRENLIGEQETVLRQIAGIAIFLRAGAGGGGIFIESSGSLTATGTSDSETPSHVCDAMHDFLSNYESTIDQSSSFALIEAVSGDGDSGITDYLARLVPDMLKDMLGIGHKEPVVA